jgi:hypothetical protein
VPVKIYGKNTQLGLHVLFSGYVYMNGDIEKIPSGVAFAAPTPVDLQAAGGAPEDRHLVNGDDAMPAGAAASGNSPTAPMATTDIEQLKQLLATQLEYYFSR